MIMRLLAETRTFHRYIGRSAGDHPSSPLSWPFGLVPQGRVDQYEPVSKTLEPRRCALRISSVSVAAVEFCAGTPRLD